MSHLHHNHLLGVEYLNDKYIFVDNDVLVSIFLESSIQDGFFQEFAHSHLLIDPLTKFEFLRVVQVDAAAKTPDLRQEFLLNDEFTHASYHSEQFNRATQMVLELAQQYSRKNIKGVSFIDFMLGVRLLMNPVQHLLVTRNRKDFPPLFFSVVSLLTWVKPDGFAENMYVLQFNIQAYDRHRSKK